jgi:aerotaxis receptor
MKVNLPVSNNEVPFPKGAILVSKTDLKGIITYANEAFIKLSGFSKEELYGKSHNLVRHPDMPSEAFKDLWSTVKKGSPWRGLVKNRRKDGDYYWVDATVVPIRKNNQTLGYMSVRREPSRQQVKEAEQLYRRVKEGKARLERPGLMKKVFQYTFLTRYIMFTLLMQALMVAVFLSARHEWVEVAAGLLVFSLLLGAGSCIFMMHKFYRPLQKAIHYFDQIAQGNIENDIPVDSTDLSGQLMSSLAYMQTHMLVIIDEISRAADTLQQGCANLEQEVAVVAAHSDEQQDRAAEVSAAIEEVSASVAQVADSTQGAATSARTSLELVDLGNRQMRMSMESISRVVEVVQASSQRMNELSEAIARIDQVTHVIKDIADQTSLLALNASIEAARAGEQGRGFAVVAQEVRGLAERTAESTSHIADIVANIQQMTFSANSSMNEAVLGVEDGIRMLKQSNDHLQEITSSSRIVTDAAAHIASATSEQSIATEAVARNMEQISALISDNRNSIKSVEVASKTLLEISEELQQLIVHFDMEEASKIGSWLVTQAVNESKR